jgi:enolase
MKIKVKQKPPIAEKISDEYLQTQIEEEVQINLEEAKNSFLAGSNHLFDFVMNYNFSKTLTFEERVTIYCQMISQYDISFEVTEEFQQKDDIEFALIFPK